MDIDDHVTTPTNCGFHSIHSATAKPAYSDSFRYFHPERSSGETPLCSHQDLPVVSGFETTPFGLLGNHSGLGTELTEGVSARVIFTVILCLDVVLLAYRVTHMGVTVSSMVGGFRVRRTITLASPESAAQELAYQCLLYQFMPADSLARQCQRELVGARCLNCHAQTNSSVTGTVGRGVPPPPAPPPGENKVARRRGRRRVVYSFTGILVSSDVLLRVVMFAVVLLCLYVILTLLQVTSQLELAWGRAAFSALARTQHEEARLMLDYFLLETNLVLDEDLARLNRDIRQLNAILDRAHSSKTNLY